MASSIIDSAGTLTDQLRQILKRNISNLEGRHVHILKEAESLDEEGKGSMKVYQADLYEKYKHTDSLVGDEKNQVKIETPTKTILVVGETGSGKTKFVDGLFNYLIGVKWDSKHRWKLTELTNEESEKITNEEVSQTEWITVYGIPCFSGGIPFAFNVIDTPGFGDTRGIQRDIELRQCLTKFFCEPSGHGIVSIDAVCILAPASNCRLTQAERYVYESILSIFGNDVTENIFVVATFAEMEMPKVFKAMKSAGIPMIDSVKINNSVLFKNNDNPETELYYKAMWNMNMDSHQKLVEGLVQTKPISTSKTKEVLQIRQELQILLENLTKKIGTSIQEMENLRDENKRLEKHLKEMEKNKDFKIPIKESKTIDVKNGFLWKTLYCKICKIECHYPCVPFTIFKWGCPIFSNSGNCRNCKTQHDKGHKSSDHTLIKTHKKTTLVETFQTKEEIEAKYNEAAGQKDTQCSVMDKIAEKYNKLKQSVMKDIESVQQCQTELNEIALQKDPLTKKDVIQFLMDREYRLRSEDYENRVNVLRKLREEAEVMEKGLPIESIRSQEDFEHYLSVSPYYQQLSQNK